MEKIIVKDNAIPEYCEIESYIQRACEFKRQEITEKEYVTSSLPPHYDDIIIKRIETILGKDIKPFFNYLRLSTKELDKDIRIHTDGNMKSQYAAVLYFVDAPMIEPDAIYGTAFYKHLYYGATLDRNLTEKIKDSVLEDDSKDKYLFTLDGIIACKRNRLLIYPADHFHCRFPYKSWGKSKTDGRIVWVSFFNILGDKDENN